MSELSIKIEGADELAARLDSEHGRMKDELRTVLLQAGQAILRGARERLVPGHGRRTGYLANSISVRAEGLNVRVGPSAYYGAFVEFGTGRRGAAGGARPWVSSYRYGQRPGMSARPYLKPAYEAEKPALLKELKALGAKIVKRLAGRP